MVLLGGGGGGVFFLHTALHMLSFSHSSSHSSTHSPFRAERVWSLLILTDFRGQISKGGQGSGARGSGRGGGGSVLRRCTLRGRCRRLAGLHVLDLVFLLLAAVTAAFSVWKRRKNAKTSVSAAAFTNQGTKNNPVVCSQSAANRSLLLLYLVVVGGAATSPLIYVQGTAPHLRTFHF